MNWVWKHSRSKNGARLVLLAIADACHSNNGTGAWPSNPELRAKTNLSERAVQSALAELQRIGELKVGYNEGPKGCNTYTILMTPADSAGGAESAPPQDQHPAESAPPQNPHETPADSASTPADSAPGTTKEPSGTTNSPPSGESAHARAKSATGRAKSNRNRTRGTRIPDDFAQTITPEMVAWFRKNCPNVDGRDQTARFVDYWSDKTGKDATKRDWVGTWRNWMRREQDKINEKQARSGNRASSASASGPRSTTDERVAAAQALKERRRARASGHPHEEPFIPPNTIPGEVA